MLMLLSTSSKVSPTVVDPARSVVLLRFDMIRKNLDTQPDSLLAPLRSTIFCQAEPSWVGSSYSVAIGCLSPSASASSFVVLQLCASSMSSIECVGVVSAVSVVASRIGWCQVVLLRCCPCLPLASVATRVVFPNRATNKQRERPRNKTQQHSEDNQENKDTQSTLSPTT